MEKRNKAPSRAILTAGSFGVPIAAGVVWLSGLVGWTVAPEVAAAVGTVISALVGYLTAGGRKGEPF